MTARGSWPFTWREPTHESQRCPKCRARLQAGISEDRCPYCGWSRHKAVPVMERTPDGLDMSLRNQIEDAVGDATDEYGRPAEKFIDFELPREQNYERSAFLVLFVGMLIFVRIAWFGHRRELAPYDVTEYVGLLVVLPVLLYLLSNFTTFLTLKLVCVVAGLAFAGTGIAVLLQPHLMPDLWAAPLAEGVASALLGYQVIAGIWAASIAWRDFRSLRR